ncbi:MAG: ATP phosphoribosyltransferase regulatory subunit, partial [Acidobacteriota bacterium]
QVAALGLPVRLYYRGEVMRYQEERAGRQREFHQLGAEILDHPEADGEAREAEALERFLALFQVAERRRRVVVLGFAGALDRLLLDAAGELDTADLVDAIGRRERRHARAAHPALLDIVERGFPERPADLGDAVAARLVRLRALRDRLAGQFPDIDLRIDLAEFADQVLAPDLLDRIGARAYYDGLVFRAFAGRAGESIGRGGRYDRLFRDLGAEVTAVGFTFSLDRLLDREATDDGENDR